MSKLKVGIVGGTGYTGAELLRLLVNHPEVELVAITSRKDAGIPVSTMFPALRGYADLAFSTPEEAGLKQCDVVFFATPHGVAIEQAPALLEAGVKVIDLGADFRIKDKALWEKWYGMEHTQPDWIAKAVYGLPEVNRTAIKSAQLIANPGCYPTAVQLGFKPLLDAGLVDTSDLIADAKSGISGAGKKAEVAFSFCETSDSFKAYGASGHRHLPEISQGLQGMAGSDKVGLTFTPHLLPINRGIEATLYANLLSPTSDDVSLEALQALYEKTYANEPFVDVMPLGSHPDTRSVRGGNTCRIAIHRPQNGRKVVVLSVIDNLVKGAAGQAIQNMNIVFGFEETTGLGYPGMIP
jgi:N-acetyl-gamma-glutamyl-phosphate reductase